MSLTVFSIMMAVLFSTVFILLIHLLRNRVFFLQSFGVHTVLVLYALCLFRSLFALELPFTVPVGLRRIYGGAFEAVWKSRIPLGDSQLPVLGLLGAVWLVTAAVLTARFLWKDFLVNRKLSVYVQNTNPFAEKVLERVKGESWRTPSVSVCVCPSIDVPMGAGLFRKCIYLPDVEYTREEMYYILKHEYTHFCDRDLSVKFWVRLFCCIFWWNPAVYLLKKDVSQILEIKCDINATRHFAREELVAYLGTIVRALKDTKGHASPSILATELVARKKKDNMRERFQLLTKAARPVSRAYQGAFLGLAVVVVVLSYSFVLQPAYDPLYC